MNKYTREQIFTLIRCCLCIGGSIGMVSNCMGIFYSPMSSALGTGVGQVAVISTCISITQGLFGPVFVRLNKRFAIQHLMSAGVLAGILCILALSFTADLRLAYMLAVIIGAGNCCFGFIPGTMLLRSWFGERNGAVNGVMMSFSGVLAALMNPVFSRVITAWGYAAGLRFMALLLAVLTLPSALTLRMKEEPQQIKTGRQYPKREISRSLLILLFVTCIITGTLTGMNTHLSSIALEAGHSLNFGASVVSAAMIANVISKLLLGSLADRMAPIPATRLFVITGAVGTAILFFLRSSEVFALLGACLYGFYFAASTVGIAMMTQAIAKERYSEIYSRITMCNSLAYALSMTAYGFLKDAFSSYSPALLIILCTSAISVTLNILLHRMSTKKA